MVLSRASLIWNTMKFFSNMLGGQGEAGSVIKDMLRDLAGIGVSHSLWERVVTNSEIEAIIDEQMTNDWLAVLAVHHPENVCELACHCVDTLEGVLESEGSKGVDDDGHTALTNAALILMRILSAMREDVVAPPSVGNGGYPQSSKAGLQGSKKPLSEHVLVRALWAPIASTPTTCSSAAGAGRPLAERIVDCSIRMLFLRGFSLEEEVEAAGGKGPVAGKLSLDPSRLWHRGFALRGGDRSGGEEDMTKAAEEAASDMARDMADKDLRNGRRLALQLLLATLYGGAPAAAVEEAALDERLHAYARQVEGTPLRAELVVSLLAAGLASGETDGLFSGTDMSVPWLSLQVLCALLQHPADASERPVEDCLGAWRPQERWRPDAVQELELHHSVPHAMRSLLGSVLEAQEGIKFVIEGVTGTLPLEGKEDEDHTLELLTLLFHLSACKAFVKGLCRAEDDEVGDLVVGILHVVFEATSASLTASEGSRTGSGDNGNSGTDGGGDDLLALLGCATLLRLTAHQEFCNALIEEPDSDLSMPTELQDVQGRLLDLLWLACVKLANDWLPSSLSRPLHARVVEANLAIVCNLSPFAMELRPECCWRLFALFERCVKPLRLKRQLTGVGGLSTYFLECFLNVVQYQFSSNMDLVYGLATRHALFSEVAGVVSELGAQREEALLRPLCGMLDALVPHLEAKVAECDTLTPDEAKAFLPPTAVGLLPVPLAYITRTVRYGALTHKELHCQLVKGVARGPLSHLYQSSRR